MHDWDFDIDVDVGPLLGADETLINARLYELARPGSGRSPTDQRHHERRFREAMLRAQWCARSRRAFDRRRALRTPLIARVHADGPAPLLTHDISLAGIGCVGTPTAPLMDVEFKLPNLDFPVDARVEMVSFAESNVTPLVGLRFVNLDGVYRDHIARYIEARRARLFSQRLAA